MSGPVKRYGRRAITRSKNWTIEDAFHALDEEFWCRNVANNPEDFVAGVCHPLEGDPGYQFWLELNGEIRQYFHIAAESPDKKGSHHPMTRKTIDAALTAIDAFYDDRYVDVDGEQVPWVQVIPNRAEWIVDRFCSPLQGWKPILSNAASILGIIQWLDIMEPGPEAGTSIEGDDGPTQGDNQGDQGDTSESGSSIKDDDALSNLKAEFENQQKEIREQRDKVDELQSKVKYLEEEDDKKQNGLKRLEDDYHRLEEKSKGQAEGMEQLRSMVVDLEAEVDQLKKHTDKQEGLNKTHLEEAESSILC
ncbi:hypothetical protein FPHYL_170 [Fusarium phyllophilum]|uniref:Uncharacterized protein n=1 Tax=Fusarium phyllophilum TaxID=47803 RepID=A0A8H5KES4_9HYPO|nr:hypothetical protein FPHYL_170 [Fusarium phyllophilum]